MSGGRPLKIGPGTTSSIRQSIGQALLRVQTIAQVRQSLDDSVIDGIADDLVADIKQALRFQEGIGWVD